jgi:hypothetical protein
MHFLPEDTAGEQVRRAAVLQAEQWLKQLEDYTPDQQQAIYDMLLSIFGMYTTLHESLTEVYPEPEKRKLVTGGAMGATMIAVISAYGRLSPKRLVRSMMESHLSNFELVLLRTEE